MNFDWCQKFSQSPKPIGISEAFRSCLPLSVRPRAVQTSHVCSYSIRLEVAKCSDAVKVENM